MNIDYLPDEMARAPYKGGGATSSLQQNAFDAGWRAACEAMHKKAHPQPAADWRAACVVRQHENGWGIYSPSGHFWLGLWHTKGMLCKVWKWRGPHKELPLYNSREVAERDLLTMQCSPPPDWEVDWEAARGT